MPECLECLPGEPGELVDATAAAVRETVLPEGSGMEAAVALPNKRFTRTSSFCALTLSVIVCDGWAVSQGRTHTLLRLNNNIVGDTGIRGVTGVTGVARGGCR